MRVTKMSGGVLGSALGLCLATTTTATVISPPIAAFHTADDSRDIVLTQAAPTWSADLSSYNNFIAEVHDVLGYYSGTNSGQADLFFQEGSVDETYGEVPFAPYAMVGSQTDGKSGYFVYKFVLPAGFKTGSGGIISTDLYFRGDPSGSASEWIGVSTSLSVEEPSHNSILNSNDFAKKTMNDLFSGGYDSYSNNSVTLSIPSDVTEFYIAVADDFSSGRLAIGSLSVNADIVAVPEPASLSLLVLGTAACIRRRRR